MSFLKRERDIYIERERETEIEEQVCYGVLQMFLNRKTASAASGLPSDITEEEACWVSGLLGGFKWHHP